jgi:peptide chain release factor 2
LTLFGGFFDLENKKQKIKNFEEESSKQDFWLNQTSASKLTKELSNLKKEVLEYENIYARLDELNEFATSFSDDNSILNEVTREIIDLENKIKSMETNAILSGERDRDNAIVSINSGAGGTEACDWAEMLLRMYLRWTEKKNFKAHILDILAGDVAGIKNVTFTISGDYAYGLMKAEVGVHRLVRISPFDSNARRHTSFASVGVIPEISDDVEIVIDEKDLRVDTYRAGGAGGQHVNKTDSAVRITHFPSGIVVQCQNERSQHQNRASAMKLLKSKLYDIKMKEQEEKKEKLAGTKKKIEWGSQIRSYILQPYRLIKDHRTDFEVGNVEKVLDGDLDEFINKFLLLQKHD